jgi:meso-butanediol dehydrogenase / (S,S)-butanediol dehydrogenase / diacetyl reductase
MTKLAALQLAKHNINVNSVCPGVTRTALSDANLAVAAQQQGISLEEMARQSADLIPLRRANDPEDIAAMICSWHRLILETLPGSRSTLMAA